MQHDGTPISLPLKVWFAAEVVFAILASTSFGLFPGSSDETAAWNVKPEVMSAVLGALYLAAGSVSVMPILAHRWEMVRVIVGPLIIFTFIETVVTFMHWDKFNTDTLAFSVWLASYILPPPILAACYVWHERRIGPSSYTPHNPLPSWMWKVLAVAGTLLCLEALLTIAYPDWIAGSAPWTFTPLSARVFAGFMLGLGAMLLSIARENDADRVRLASPFLILALPATLFQAFRFAEQVDWTHPRLWIFSAILALAGAIGLMLAKGDWRRSLA